LQNCLSIDSDGLSGGLVVSWDEYINVSLLAKWECYIDILVTENPDGVPWRATFVYGEPSEENRRDMWALMCTLCGAWSGPWMLIGDFNEAMWQYEHFSENPRPERQMMDFCEVENTDWTSLFPGAGAAHLTSSRSDHKALLLSLQPDDRAPRTQTFLFEIMWEREELGRIVEQAWNKQNPGSDLGALASALQYVTKELKAWSKEKFGNVTKELEQLKQELESLEQEGPISYRKAILKAKGDLDELLFREEMM